MERLVQQLPPKERACVLLKDVFDYTLEEIADLVESTPGGVKAALHRGREKLRTAQPPHMSRATLVVSNHTRHLLELYVERFNRGDWDGLRDLIAADATLRVADRFEGSLSESFYFTRYARSPVPLRAVLSDVDGEPAVAILAGIDGSAAVRAFVRLSVAGGRIVAIADYTHCQWVMSAADHVSPVPARA